MLPQLELPVPGPGRTRTNGWRTRLKAARGKALYKQRRQTVEPAFGIIKEVLGFRRFSLRGRAKMALREL